MRYYHLIIAIFLVCQLSVSIANANDGANIGLNTGITTSDRTTINLTDGYTTVTDKSTGLSFHSSVLINDVLFVPSLESVDGTSLVWGTGEKSFLILDDPVVKFIYSYSGDQLKETIVLKEDKLISFEINVSKGAKLIPWTNGEYKIVREDMSNTMDGLVAKKPFGIDAKGNYIVMDYNLDEKRSVLSLVYNKTIGVYNETATNEYNKQTKESVFVPQYDIIPISYPLMIDPTWVSFNSHWIDNTSISGQTIEMWNVSGGTTWTAPSGVTSVWYLVVGGGGGCWIYGIFEFNCWWWWWRWGVS